MRAHPRPCRCSLPPSSARAPWSAGTWCAGAGSHREPTSISMPGNRCMWTPGPRTTRPACGTAGRSGRPCRPKARRRARDCTASGTWTEAGSCWKRSEKENKKMSVFAIVVLVIVVIFVSQGVRIVPQQNAWVVERLGRYHTTLTPGFNVIIPFVDRVAYRHGLKEIPLDVPSQVCITRDNTQLQVDGILYFQVTDPTRASYGSSNYIVAVTQLAQTSLRSVIGKLELDKTFEERDIINAQVVQAIDEAALNWGVKVLRYEIKDLTPPEAILLSMQRQITAEREKRALIAASEGRRQEQINIATGEREASIARSEGEKQADINKAQGEAAAILLVAEATAGAIRQVADAIRQPGGEQAVQLKVPERAVDAFRTVAHESKTTLVIPSHMGEVSALIASAMQMVRAGRGAD